MLDFSQDGNIITVSYYGEDGEIVLDKYNLPDAAMFNYALEERGRPAPPALNINRANGEKHRVTHNFDGRKVKKAKARNLNKYRRLEVLNKIAQVGRKKEQLTGSNLPKMWYFDIETFMTPGPLDVTNPDGEVHTIAYCNDFGFCEVLGTRDLAPIACDRIQDDTNKYFKQFNLDYEFTFNYIKFDNERDMLNHFLRVSVPKMPFMTGWNCIDFDWAYLVNRAKKYYNLDIKCTSPTGTLKKYFFGNDPKKRFQVDLPHHRGIMDYLVAFKNWDRSVQVKSKLSLDWVSSEVLGVKKISYVGNLNQLYERDFVKYVYYNIVDCILVAMLHRKLGTINLAHAFSNIALVPLTDTTMQSTMLDSMFIKMFNKRGYTIVKDYDALKKNRQDDGYIGAYVQAPTQLGKHKHVTTYDFSGLYPNGGIRMHNISVDTFLGMVTKDDEGNQLRDKYVCFYTQNEIAVDPNKHVVSTSGAVFTKEFRGVPVDVADTLANKRDIHKYGWREMAQEIEYLKKVLKQKKLGQTPERKTDVWETI